MRREYLLLILLFLAGMWIAQLIGKEYFNVYGYLNPYHLKSFAELEMEYVELFWRLLWTRGKQFLTIWILRMTPCKRILPVMLKLLLSFLLGFFLMVCCMAVGATGILVLLSAILPHGICYFIAVVGILDIDQMLRWEDMKKGRSMVRKIGLSTLFLISGCILETIVGTTLLRHVLKASSL